jgi:hypothetical protein
MAMRIKRIIVRGNPFPVKEDCCYDKKMLLPCHWITAGNPRDDTPVLMRFQLDFMMECEDTFKIHVSADQQYILHIDGKYAGRGCEMKSPESWFFETYEIVLEKGAHSISSLVWNYGSLSPMNRMSVFPGFFLMPDERHIPALGTGTTPWKVCKLTGVTFSKLKIVPWGWMSVPPHETIDCREFFHENDEGDWYSAQIAEQGRNGFISTEGGVHLLKPSMTEVMVSEAIQPRKAVFISGFKDESGHVPEKCDEEELEYFNSNLNRTNITFPANTVKRIIFDLGNYFCAYAFISLKGGLNGRIRITWAEAGFTDREKHVKGERDTVAGKYFRGLWDEFILDGESRTLSPLSWRCGRFIELYAVTANEPLEIEAFTLRETRYPLEMDGGFSCDDGKINEIMPFCFRTLQMCAHDNFTDCPFYEQLLYAGDGRLELLVNLVACRDDTLVRKAISTLASSRDMNGFTMCRWPSNLRLCIPSFSLWWIGMVYDYALWRGDKAFITSFMPSIRFLIDNFIGRFDEDGFLRGHPQELNFIDWIDEWYKRPDEWGIPPGMNDSVNASYNWLFVYVLELARKLEDYAGDDFLSKRWSGISRGLSEKLIRRFWDFEKGLFKEDDSGNHFSEHAQILAILSDNLEEQYLERLKQSLFSTDKLSRSSIFYKHYFFEACARLCRPDKILSGLALWNNFLEKGFKTSPETPENKTFSQRSDCHGWGAHPIYHLISNIAGIKPLGMEFRKVQISPMMDTLSEVDVKCIHPEGVIEVKYRKKAGKLYCSIDLPSTLDGEFRYGKDIIELKPGTQNFAI